VGHWLVEVSEVGGEDEGGQERCDGKSDIWPDEVWVGDGSGTSERDGSSDGGREETDSVDQTLHPRGCSSVGELVGGNVNENLSNSGNSVEDQLPPKTDGRDTSLTFGSVVSTWRGLVDLPLHDGTGNHVDCTKLETDKDPSHGLDGSTDPLKEGVDTVGDDGNSDNDEDRVEIVHDIVGGTVESHTGRHGVLHGSDTTIGENEDRNDEENLASLDGILDFVNKLVVPEDLGGVEGTVSFVHVGRLGDIPERDTSLVSGKQLLPVSIRESLSEDVACLEEDGTLGWGLVKSLGAPEENNGGEGVQDSGLEESEPESNKSFGIGGGESEDGTDIDTPVEDEQVSLDSCLGVDDDLLSLLGVRDGGDLDGRLVTEQRSERRLDETSSEREADEEDDKQGESGGGGDDGGNGGNDQEEMGNNTDSGTDTDGLESTPLGVGDDSTEDGDDVGQEGKHGSDGGSLDGTETEGSGRLVDTGSTGSDGTSAVSTDGKLSSNEILEDELTSVVGCSFTKLDEAHGDTDPADGGRDPVDQRKLCIRGSRDSLSQGLEFLLGGL
jgi:hypothetical protein